MHEPIRNNIEAYLGRSEAEQLPAEFSSHLRQCKSCRSELEALELQSGLLRLLRPAEEMDPRPGFYARVIERIETQRQVSFWSIFLEPVFGRRIAFASAALALLMGVYLISADSGTNTYISRNATPAVNEILDREDQPGPVLGMSAEQDRNAVLVNLVTYREQ